jgi:hypothetical protein
MGLQSGRLTAAGEHQSRFGSTAGMYDPFAEESTDVLRRRAENLLDEMMLGTADLGGDYAGENGAAGHANGVFTPMEAGVANGVAGESRPSNHDRFEYPAAAAQRATESFAPSSAPALARRRLHRAQHRRWTLRWRRATRMTRLLAAPRRRREWSPPQNGTPPLPTEMVARGPMATVRPMAPCAGSQPRSPVP